MEEGLIPSEAMEVYSDKENKLYMNKAALVVMAAGIGSRFGGGIKQLEPVGPDGRIIIDYSIYDALKAGFNKVVFVIRKDLEKDFKERIGDRIAEYTEVDYVYQELSNIPKRFLYKAEGRKKPWGTGQAVLCCREVVDCPFLVINADDYYGKEAYEKAYRFLTEHKKKSDKLSACMVGFILKNTLSDNGGVTRGVCKVDENHMLTNIVETHNIVKSNYGARVENESEKVHFDDDSEVSMNMWGFFPEIFDVLEQGFAEFLTGIKEGDIAMEYLLPTIIDSLVKAEKIEVTVLQSRDRWFGVTYKEDKVSVIEEIKRLTEAGAYEF